MASPSKGKRLLRRYPILAPVPEEERAKVVRAALRNPLVMVIIGCLGFFILPPYFKFALQFLRVEEDPVLLMQLAKVGAAVILPIAVAVPLLSHYVMPYFLRTELKKQGYLKEDDEEQPEEGRTNDAQPSDTARAQPAGQEATPDAAEAPSARASDAPLPEAPETDKADTPADGSEADKAGETHPKA